MKENKVLKTLVVMWFIALVGLIFVSCSKESDVIDELYKPSSERPVAVRFEIRFDPVITYKEVYNILINSNVLYEDVQIEVELIPYDAGNLFYHKQRYTAKVITHIDNFTMVNAYFYNDGRIESITVDKLYDKEDNVVKL